MKIFQVLAKALANSPFLSKGKKLWEINKIQKYSISLTKFDKLITGFYLILNDYSQDEFPPKFEDIQKAYSAEIEYADRHIDEHFILNKPFVYEVPFYLEDFIYFWKLLRRYYAVSSEYSLLELGAGTGWMSILLAQLGFKMTASSIAQSDCNLGLKKADYLGLSINFVCSSGEEIEQAVDQQKFDGIFIYEALHHCFDWRKVCKNASLLLKPGGHFFILNEPNLVHTAVSYRVSKLENTHEIGFKRWEIVNYLKSLGFQVKVIKGDWFFKPMWIVASKI